MRVWSRRAAARAAILMPAIAAVLTFGSRASADGAAAPDATPRLTAVPIEQVQINDPFWSPKLEVWRRVTVADCLDKFEHDGTLANFDHIAKDELSAPHGGEPWFDGLLYEMIRAGADLMRERPDTALKTRLDGYIDRIAAAAAKDPDGYVNTYTQLKEPTHRWGTNGGNDRWQHDCYNAGCLVDAAVHYYRATGETKLLATAVRCANGMCKVMGPSPRQNIIPGHAIGEESLTRLYELFKEQPALKDKLGVPVDADAYLALAKFWVDARGHHDGRPDFGAYDQDAVPALEQQTIEGHAVRAALFTASMTAVGEASGDARYVEVAQRLWQNMVGRRMYVTGGIGSFANDEKFGPDYVLPNDGYLETCAAVANAFLDHDLNLALGDAATIDELERSLYNNALAGVSLAGNSYFYENPLSAGPQRQRWAWHACPCCPPMFLKLMGALPGYVYASDASSKAVYVNLFVGSHAEMKLAGNASVSLTQATKYPWDGGVRLTVEPSRDTAFDLFVRVPGWTNDESIGGLYHSRPVGGKEAFTVRVNGQPVEFTTDRGYAKIARTWHSGDVVDVEMSMPVRRVTADEQVEADRGRVALTRGPIVYCVESIDNGGQLGDLIVPDDAALAAEPRPDLLGGVTVLGIAGRRATSGDAPVEITAIPYYANANRGPAEMLTWLSTTAGAGATADGIKPATQPTTDHRRP